MPGRVVLAWKRGSWFIQNPFIHVLEKSSKASYSGVVVPVGTAGRSKEASKRTPEVLFGGSAIIPMCRNF